MVCEISQPKIAPCENGHLLRNNFAATRCPLRIKDSLRNGPFAAKPFRSLRATPCENFHNCETHIWHTSAISQPMPPFCSCEILCESPRPLKAHFRSPSSISQLRKHLRNPPLAHECHFTAAPPHFAAPKWAVKMGLRYEMAPPLRKSPTVTWLLI